jgi:hypothetical protein
LPAAKGASGTGCDSLNRTRKKPKYYPGRVKPKPPPGPGTPAPAIFSAPANSNARVRLSTPPSEFANKAPIPPAMAGTVVGQPLRKRLKTDDDPFGAVGDYAGSFLVKSAVELSGGYDTNPGRTLVSKGSPFYVVAPEFLAVWDWDRHAVVAEAAELMVRFAACACHCRAKRQRVGAKAPPDDRLRASSRQVIRQSIAFDELFL